VVFLVGVSDVRYAFVNAAAFWPVASVPKMEAAEPAALTVVGMRTSVNGSDRGARIGSEKLA
jgi:hypothetical protein